MKKPRAKGADLILNIEIGSIDKKLFDYITRSDNAEYTSDSMPNLYHLPGLDEMITSDNVDGDVSDATLEAFKDLCDFAKSFGATYVLFEK